MSEPLPLLNQRYGDLAPQLDLSAGGDVLQLLLQHRSVRSYRPDPLPEGALETIIAAAQSASTSSNLQVWSVVAVRDPARRDRLAELAGNELSAAVLSVGVVMVAASFALITLRLLHESKRPKLDAVQLLWRVAMVSALLACALWLLTRVSDTLTQWQSWPLLFGALVLFGGFMSVILGMLYKIVPFLVWLHLQNRGQGRLMAPNVKKVLAEKHIQGQMQAHFVAFGLLLLAVFWPAWFTYPAGLTLVVANGWLLRNLLSAVAVYRSHLAKIEALAPQRD